MPPAKMWAGTEAHYTKVHHLKFQKFPCAEYRVVDLDSDAKPSKKGIVGSLKHSRIAIDA